MLICKMLEGLFFLLQICMFWLILRFVFSVFFLPLTWESNIGRMSWVLCLPITNPSTKLRKHANRSVACTCRNPGGSAILWLCILVPVLLGGVGGTSARNPVATSVVKRKKRVLTFQDLDLLDIIPHCLETVSCMFTWKRAVKIMSNLFAAGSVERDSLQFFLFVEGDGYQWRRWSITSWCLHLALSSKM